MKKSLMRFTIQEKLLILREVQLNGLEPTLRKYHLTIEILIGWQRKFIGSRAGSSIHLIEDIYGKEETSETVIAKPITNEKEDAFLKFLSSLIAQCVFDGDMRNR